MNKLNQTKADVLLGYRKLYPMQLATKVSWTNRYGFRVYGSYGQLLSQFTEHGALKYLRAHLQPYRISEIPAGCFYSPAKRTDLVFFQKDPSILPGKWRRAQFQDECAMQSFGSCLGYLVTKEKADNLGCSN